MLIDTPAILPSLSHLPLPHYPSRGCFPDKLLVSGSSSRYLSASDFIICSASSAHLLAVSIFIFLHEFVWCLFFLAVGVKQARSTEELMLCPFCPAAVNLCMEGSGV